ncbi:MAG: pyridoxamine 5'-phosphate oxidase family protein [Oscillospiraceae bacterium]
MKLNAKVMDFLKANKVWNVATFGEGKAHVVPCYHTAVVDEETLVISAVFMKTSLKNIAENGSVAITVYVPTPEGRFEGYQVIGTAHVEKEGPMFDLAKGLVGAKPLPFNCAVVVKVDNGTITSPGPNVGKSFDSVQW